MANSAKMTAIIRGEETKAQISTQVGFVGDFIKIGKGKKSQTVQLLNECGDCNYLTSFEKAEQWFNNDYYYGTDNHILVISNGNVFCATLIK